MGEDRESPADRKVSFTLQIHKVLSCTLEDLDAPTQDRPYILLLKEVRSP